MEHNEKGKRRVELVRCRPRNHDGGGDDEDDLDVLDGIPGLNPGLLLTTAGDDLRQASQSLVRLLLGLVRQLERTISRPCHPLQLNDRLRHALGLLSELQDVIGQLNSHAERGVLRPGQRLLLHSLERVRDFVERKLQEIQSHCHVHARTLTKQVSK